MSRSPLWAAVVPVLALARVGAALMLPVGAAFIVVAVPALVGTVLAAVHHAEVVAHRAGEPFQGAVHLVIFAAFMVLALAP